MYFASFSLPIAIGTSFSANSLLKAEEGRSRERSGVRELV
jgi:hypothetical protein